MASVLAAVSRLGMYSFIAPFSTDPAYGGVYQNNELIAERERHGDGNLAVALNESALYLGSALGAGVGGLLFLLHLPVWTLLISAAAVAFLGIVLQLLNLRTDQFRLLGTLSEKS
jgi:predicted MFS family arabinose efflux permease